MRRKLLLALLAISIVLLGYVLVYANGNLLSGFIGRKGLDPNAGNRGGTKILATAEVPWWCVEDCDGFYSIDTRGNIICNPHNDSSDGGDSSSDTGDNSEGVRGILLGPSTKNGDSSSGTTNVPGKPVKIPGRDGDNPDREAIPGVDVNATIDPETITFYGLSPQILEVFRIATSPTPIKYPVYISPALIDTINGNTGNPGTPNIPPITVPIDDGDLGGKDNYNECSCDASAFTLDSFGDVEFYCPRQGEVVVFDESYFGSEYGSNQTVTAYTPDAGQCAPDLKDNEIVYIGRSCGCDEKLVHIDDTNQDLRCPEPGGFKTYESGQYVISLWSPAKYQCDEKMACPDGYGYNWLKIYNDCREAKKDMCSGENIDEDLANACDAFEPTMWNRDCPDEDDCKETEALFNDGVSHYEITGQGLPSPSDCFLY